MTTSPRASALSERIIAFFKATAVIWGAFLIIASAAAIGADRERAGAEPRLQADARDAAIKRIDATLLTLEARLDAVATRQETDATLARRQARTDDLVLCYLRELVRAHSGVAEGHIPIAVEHCIVGD